jgi:acyl-CoA thioesterase I
MPSGWGGQMADGQATSALPAALAQRLEAGGTLSFVGLGDSLTHGWMVGRGFFDRACDALVERQPALVLARVNAGVPGDTAFGGLGRVGSLLAAGPDLVLVQFGLNDCFSGERPDVYQRHLGRIVQEVRDASAFPVLGTSCPLSSASAMRVAAPFYRAMREVGASERVLVADTCAHWLEAESRGEVPRRLWQPDGVHPTDAGHALMARGLVRALLDTIGPR